VHVTVHHRLVGDLAAVHADVEALHRPVLGQDIEAGLIKGKVDRRCSGSYRSKYVEARRRGLPSEWRVVTG
jgi:hypothetical protein